MKQLPTITLTTFEGEDPTNDEIAVFEELQKCFDKFVRRNRGRHGVWRRSGIRGQTHELYAKSERAYIQTHTEREIPDPDHYQDLVNYAIFALVLLRQHQMNVDIVAGEGVTVIDGPKLEEIRKINERFLYGEWPR